MTLWVTGGAGFIGSAVIRQAVAAGRQVLNIDSLTYAANLANIETASSSSLYAFSQTDIRDVEALTHLYQSHPPSAVMHLAAESHVDRSIDGPAAFIETNIMGTFNLLATAKDYWKGLDETGQKSFRFHHVSTDEVYGDLDVNDPAFTESHAYDPSSPYSASKAASDHLVRAWHRTYKMPVVITNCSNNYGPYQFPEKLIPVVILKCLSGETIPVYGKGDNIRDWLYVDDHADALLTVLDTGRIGETYNIGGNNERTNLDLVHTICGIMDGVAPRPDGAQHRSTINFVTDRPGHDRRYAINAEKIKTDLGWKPAISFDEGFEQTVRWYADNRDWWEPLLFRDQVGTRIGLNTDKNEH